MLKSYKSILLLSILIFAGMHSSTALVQNQQNETINDTDSTSRFSPHSVSNNQMDQNRRNSITSNNNNGQLVPNIGSEQDHNTIVIDPHDIEKDNFVPVEESSIYHYYMQTSNQLEGDINPNLPIVSIFRDKIEYIVKHDSTFDLEEFEQYTSSMHVDILKTYEDINTVLVSVELIKLSKFVYETTTNFGVDFVEPNFYNRLNFVPDDPEWSNQWGPQHIGMESAWNTSLGNQNITVAVIDTGIDYNHPDLSNQYVATGYDWYNDDSDPFDDHYHGTHVAGTIAATINNTIGVSGVANVSVMAEKIFSTSGAFAGTADAVAAIDHAVAQGANILSNSWGGGAYSQLLADAVWNAVGNGSMFIAAAGNDASDALQYPAAYPGAISVSATDSSDQLASFSNYGDWVDIAAPGVDILSTYPLAHANGPYYSISGTSMATPHVSGLAALIMSNFPDYTIAQVEELLYISADDIGEAGFDNLFGNGRINATKAMLGLPDHELRVSHNVPSTLRFNETISLESTIINIGAMTETNVDFELYLDSSLVNSTNITSLNSGDNVTLTYEWTPTEIGSFNFTAVTPIIEGEFYEDNNEIMVLGSVVDLENYEVTYPSYQWFDAQANGINLGMSGDDISTSVTLPFNFTFYDQNFTELYVSSNGWFSFVDTSPTDFSNPSFPSSAFEYVIAPLWDDLRSANNVYFYNTSEYAVIEYVDVYHYSGPLSGTFAVVLYENGGIVFLYDDISYSGSPTVGLNYGVDITYYNSYTTTMGGINDFAIGYNYIPPEYETSISTTIPTVIEANFTNTIEVELTNGGRYNETNLEIQLFINGTLVNSTVIPELTPFNQTSLFYDWIPTVEGIYNITAYSPPHVNDSVLENNRQEFSTPFIIPEGRVGFITVHGEIYSSSIASIYESNGYSVLSITSMDQYNFSFFDLLIILDGGSYWPAGDLQILDSYLNSGGRVAVMGDSSISNYSWTSQYGITYSSTNAYSGYTSNLGVHPLVENVTQIYGGGPLSSLYYNENGTSIAMDSADTYSLAGVSKIVNLVVYSDDMTSYATTGDNEVFLLNMVTNWYVYEEELMVSLSDVEYPLVGENYIIDATIYNFGINNASNLNFTLYLDDNLVNITSNFNLTYGASITLTFNWSPVSLGTHNFTANVSILGGERSFNNQLTNLIDVVDRDLAYGFTQIWIYDNDTSFAVENVHVTVYNSTADLIDSGYTDISGYYNVTGLDIGAYTYYANLTGYFNQSFSNSISFIGQNQINNLYLQQIYDYDLQVSLTTPDFVSIYSTNEIIAEVINDGQLTASDVEFSIFINNQTINTTTISSFAPQEIYNLTFNWIPLTEGNFNITAYAIPVVDEDILNNNRVTSFSYVYDPSNSVAVLNSASSDQPGYWQGGWANSYSTIVNGLNNVGIYTEAITNSDIVGGSLLEFGVLILIDNAPSDSASSIVKSWWEAGGSILSFDSSISVLNWIGALPSESEGANGYNTYWDYGSVSTGTLINSDHPISDGYSNGSTIHGVSGNAQYFSSLMQSTIYGDFYTPIVKSVPGSDYDYVSASNAPIGGKVVQFWDSGHWSTSSNQQMILNIISWFGSSQNDLSVNLDVPNKWGVEKETDITANFSNLGEANATNANISLFVNSQLVNYSTIAEFVAGSVYSLTFNWLPLFSGTYNVTAYISPMGNETRIENNNQTIIVEVTEPLPLLPGDYQTYSIFGNTTESYTFGNWATNNLSLNVVREVRNLTTDALISTETFTINLLDGMITGGSMNGTYYWGMIHLIEFTIGMTIGWYDTTMQLYDNIDYNFRGSIRNAWMGYSSSYNTVVVVDNSTGLILGYGYGSIELIETNLLSTDGSPTIDSPDDISYASIEVGNVIPWIIYDADPDNYTIFLNGSIFITGTFTSGVPINVNIDGIGIGFYNFTILAFDRTGNSVNDTVFVTVSDISTPDVSDIEDTTINVGNSITLSWSVYDENPGQYILYRGGTVIQEGTWTSNVTLVLEGLSIGSHHFTLVVYDQFGNQAVDWVTISVVDPDPAEDDPYAPILDNLSNITIEFGEDYTLSWNVWDRNPGTYTLYQGEFLIAEGLYEELITFDLIDYEVGIYFFTLTVSDEFGNEVIDYLEASVVDTTIPEIISAPNNQSVIIGEDNSIMSWEFSDPHPGTYILLLNETIISLNSWNNSEALTFNLANVANGFYNLTIIVQDYYGNTVTHFALISVSNSEGDFGGLGIILGIASVVAIVAVGGLVIRSRRKP